MRAMKPIWKLLVFSVMATASPAIGALGPLIYSQPPNHNLAHSSDTAWLDDIGRLTSSLFADRFVLNQSASISQIVFYGTYGREPGNYPDPPASELIQVLIYTPRDLTFPFSPPGDILYEDFLAHVDRSLTGAFAAGRPEYRFVLDLSSSFDAAQGTPFWLSIAQVGDPESVLRWESSTGGENAHQFPIGTEWVVSAGGLAYELRVPEPTSALVLVGTTMTALLRRSRHRR